MLGSDGWLPFKIPAFFVNQTVILELIRHTLSATVSIAAEIRIASWPSKNFIFPPSLAPLGTRFSDPRAVMAGRGEACYFPRDLNKGSYGGDVHCYQQYLSHKGYLLDEPTGYFGERTATATRRWQRDNGISGDDAGEFGEWSRERYASTHGLPLPGEGRVFKDAKSDEVRNRFSEIIIFSTATAVRVTSHSRVHIYPRIELDALTHQLSPSTHHRKTRASTCAPSSRASRTARPDA